jgi:hypothetical protein
MDVVHTRRGLVQLTIRSKQRSVAIPTDVVEQSDWLEASITGHVRLDTTSTEGVLELM